MTEPIKNITILNDPLTKQAFGKSVEWQESRNTMVFRYPIKPYKQLQQSHLSQALNIDSLTIEQNIKQHKCSKDIKHLRGIKNIIAVASGKGGVGKSTISVMLAKALQQLGANAAILDADIYGPSIPKMLGKNEKPESPDHKSFIPVDADGIQTMSLGYILDEKSPAIWRGAMVTKALMQMIEDTRWKDVDYLIMDLPPGTGDIQLTMIQRIPVTAAILVTTPQDIALLDAQKALAMFQKVEVPVLGVIENMSTWVCENCGHESPIFGENGGAKMAAEFKVELLGQLPLNIDVRKTMDAGQPELIWNQSHELNEKALLMASRAAQNLAQLPIKFKLSDSLKLTKI